MSILLHSDLYFSDSPLTTFSLLINFHSDFLTVLKIYLATKINSINILIIPKPTIDIVCLYKERWFHIWYQREKVKFWNAVMRCQHASQCDIGATSGCRTGKCADISLLHSTSVLHQICGTTVPFDLRCESVTCYYAVDSFVTN